MVRVVERLPRSSPWALDGVLATAFLVAGLLTTAAGHNQDPKVIYEHRDGFAFALILVATVPYYARRRAPLPVYLVTTAAIATLSLLGYNEGVLPLAAGVGLYTVGAYRPAREAVFAAVVMAVTLLLLYVGGSPGFGAGELLSTATGFGVAVLIGWSMQARHLRLEALEHEQKEAARRAAADERLRIAQELHDVVAHSLGVIAVQAGVGMKLIDTDPGEARRALDHISRTSRSSLAEIRRVLGMVRDREGAPAYTPAPGLADLPRLARDVTGAGLLVDLAVNGDVSALPPGVELAAYRIVQEALTNALRHAGATRATVRLDGDGSRLRIEVTDDGRGPNGAGSSGGHGLVGMRERVAVYGGSLEAGARPGGGFRVAADLPYEATVA